MSAPATLTPVDFDLAGVVGVRLVDAGEREVAAVTRQLGPLRRALVREPDLVLRFVAPGTLGGADLCTIGLEDAAWSGDDFLLLRGKHKSRACVRVPFDRLGADRSGGGCELTCERGLAAVPLLVPMLNFTALARGLLPLHASAFVHDGRGIVATGWSKGGKTETLLAFMARGARYVGDEWTYLARDGSAMSGIPEPIRLWSWHFDSLPELRARLSPAERARLSLLGALAGGMRRATDGGRRHGSAATRTLNRASALVRTQLCVDLAPERLFPGSLPVNGAALAPVRPEVLLFVVTHERPEIEVRPIDPQEVAERMRASLAEEDQRLVACYQRFRFAFPGRTNALFERAAELRAELLRSSFAHLSAYEVRHPYPVSLPALHDALVGPCSARGAP